MPKDIYKILLLLGGLIIGFFVNYYANKITNEKLFAQIKAEIDSIKQKQQTTRLTASEQERLQQLQGALQIVYKKL